MKKAGFAVSAGVLLALALVGWFIWPTPYREGREKFYQGIQCQTVRKSILTGRLQVRDSGGWRAVSPDDDDLTDLKGGRPVVAAVVKGGKWGFIDQAGRFLIKPTFKYENDRTEAPLFSNGLAAMKLGDKWGFIDLQGKEAIKAKYDYAWDFSDGLAAVSSDKKWGYIDASGKVVIKPRYDFPGAFSDGVAAVSSSKEYSIIDRTGKSVVGHGFQQLSAPAGRYVSLFTTTDTRMLIFLGAGQNSHVEASACWLTSFSCGRGLVRRDGEWLMVDRNGSAMSSERFDGVGRFSQGLAAVKKGEKWGYVDTTGRLVIAPRFDSAGCFRAGLAPVVVKEKWGYIDQKGRMVIEPQFDEAKSFYDRLAPVKVGKLWGFVDRSGKTVIKPQYTDAGEFRLRASGK